MPGMLACGPVEASCCVGTKCCLEGQVLHHPDGRKEEKPTVWQEWEGPEHQRSGGWASGRVNLRCSRQRLQENKSGLVDSLKGPE